ncbi:MAG: SGNH/GDSL hydrolase family protein [Patescibacteria group bacterium]
MAPSNFPVRHRSIRIFVILFILFSCLLTSLIYIYTQQKQKNDRYASIRYVAVGDSYTIGLGVKEESRWPNMLVEALNKTNKNKKVILLANLAVSGYTVEDTLRYELPQLALLKPDFMTLLIGANDNFKHTDPAIFKKNFIRLLDAMQKSLPHPQNILVITLPDHTKAPGWQLLSSDKWKDSERIFQYNTIIKSEAKKRGLAVADIHPISQGLTDIRYFISDGLHPSHEGYNAWTDVIFKQAETMTRNIRK